MKILKLLAKIAKKIYLNIQLWKIILFEKLLGLGYVNAVLVNDQSLLTLPLLKRFGATIGKNVNVKGGIKIENAFEDQDSKGDFSNLSIGDNCYIGYGVLFDLPDEIILKDEVVLSAGVKILTHQDCGGRKMKKWYPRKKGKVQIGSGTWIGANAVILAGVELGECCVIGAGSIVTKSFPPFSVIVGVPGKKIKQLS